MPLSSRKRALLGLAFCALAAVAVAGTFCILLTRDVPLEWQQDPNKVELLEAGRKLKLLNEAQANKRKGFVRLSEVEINSFLEDRYQKNAGLNTNAPADIQIHQTAVLLTSTNLTFVTKLTKTIAGIKTPFVWQRTVVPRKEEKGWAFDVVQMRLGRCEIPPRFWGRVEGILGAGDSIFKEREVWLSQLPAITLTRNELSQAPELRLYTFLPEARLVP